MDVENHQGAGGDQQHVDHADHGERQHLAKTNTPPAASAF